MNNKRKGGQKYQNKVEYTLKYQPILAKLKEETPKDNLCQRCFEQIEWKLKFGKYKKVTQPRRCQICEQKSVVKSYRHICDACVKAKGVCSKCGLTAQLRTAMPKALEKIEETKRFQMMDNYLKTLRECSRRKIIRLMGEGVIDYVNGVFIYKETSQPVEGIQLKKKYRVKVEGQEGENVSDDDCEDSRDIDDDEMAYIDAFIKSNPKVAEPLNKEDMKDQSGSLCDNEEDDD